RFVAVSLFSHPERSEGTLPAYMQRRGVRPETFLLHIPKRSEGTLRSHMRPRGVRPETFLLRVETSLSLCFSSHPEAERGNPTFSCESWGVRPGTFLQRVGTSPPL